MGLMQVRWLFVLPRGLWGRLWLGNWGIGAEKVGGLVWPPFCEVSPHLL
jgi:hypothetical protein